MDGPFPRLRLIGCLLAMLALLGQVTGAIAMPEMAAEAMAWGPICVSDAPAPPGNTAPVHHHKQDCAVCPLCAAASVHVAIMTAPAGVPTPTTAILQTAAPLPPARAPPGRFYRPGHPRGPPALA